MATNFEVRMLLVVWASEGGSIGKSALNKRFNCKSAETNAVREKLMAAGAIEASADGKLFTLMATGKAVLAEALEGDEFLFDGSIIGAKIGNDLLKWYRSQPKNLPVVQTVGSSIGSYEVFKGVALEVYDALNRDLKLEHLVPIYRIRREIGQQISRNDFNSWLLKMQTEKIFRLQGGSVEDSSPDKIEDSITTEVSGLRCFAKRL